MTGHHCKRCGEPSVWDGVFCEDCGWVDCTGVQTELDHVIENHEDFEEVELVQDDSDGVVLEAPWQDTTWTFHITHDPILHDHQIHGRADDDSAIWTPGGVDYKYDAIAYVLDAIGAIDDFTVSSGEAVSDRESSAKTLDCGDVVPSDPY